MTCPQCGQTCMRSARVLGTSSQQAEQRCDGLSWRVSLRCSRVPASSALYASIGCARPNAAEKVSRLSPARYRTPRPGVSTVPRALRLMVFGASCSVAITAQLCTMRVVSLCTKSLRRLAIRPCSRAMRCTSRLSPNDPLRFLARWRCNAASLGNSTRSQRGFAMVCGFPGLAPGVDAIFQCRVVQLAVQTRSRLEMRRLRGIRVEFERDIAPLHAVFYPDRHGTTSANRPLDPLLPGRLRLSDAARRAGRGKGMREHMFKRPVRRTDRIHRTEGGRRPRMGLALRRQTAISPRITACTSPPTHTCPCASCSMATRPVRARRVPCAAV